MDNVAIVRNSHANRFELLSSGQRIGLIDYTQNADVLTMTHTEVSEQYSGRGLAARLVAAALADVRSSGQRVVAACPYIRGYIVQHPEWADLVEHDSHQQSGMA